MHSTRVSDCIVENFYLIAGLAIYPVCYTMIVDPRMKAL